MQFYKYFLVLACVLATIISSSLATKFLEPSDDKHENRPRLFGSIFSRPKPEGEKQLGGGLKEHLGNVLRGGSIGFQGEIAPLAPLHGLIDHAKKIIPQPVIPGFGKPGTGSNLPGSWWEEPEKKEPEPDYKEPDYKEPEPDYKEPDYKEPEKKEPEPDYKEPDYKEPEYKEPDYKDPQPPVDEKPTDNDEYGGNQDWVPQNPKDVKTDGPRWEDIGEGDYGYTTVPIEEIIQPRIRGKRRVESQVFHVPVEFSSNAKPYAVKVRSMIIP